MLVHVPRQSAANAAIADTRAPLPQPQPTAYSPTVMSNGGWWGDCGEAFKPSTATEKTSAAVNHSKRRVICFPPSLVSLFEATEQGKEAMRVWLAFQAANASQAQRVVQRVTGESNEEEESAGAGGTPAIPAPPAAADSDSVSGSFPSAPPSRFGSRVSSPADAFALRRFPSFDHVNFNLLHLNSSAAPLPSPRVGNSPGAPCGGPLGMSPSASSSAGMAATPPFVSPAAGTPGAPKPLRLVAGTSSFCSTPVTPNSRLPMTSYESREQSISRSSAMNRLRNFGNPPAARSGSTNSSVTQRYGPLVPQSAVMVVDPSLVTWESSFKRLANRFHRTQMGCGQAAPRLVHLKYEDDTVHALIGCEGKQFVQNVLRLRYAQILCQGAEGSPIDPNDGAVLGKVVPIDEEEMYYDTPLEDEEEEEEGANEAAAAGSVNPAAAAEGDDLNGKRMRDERTRKGKKTKKVHREAPPCEPEVLHSKPLPIPGQRRAAAATAPAARPFPLMQTAAAPHTGYCPTPSSTDQSISSASLHDLPAPAAAFPLPPSVLASRVEVQLKYHDLASHEALLSSPQRRARRRFAPPIPGLPSSSSAFCKHYVGHDDTLQSPYTLPTDERHCNEDADVVSPRYLKAKRQDSVDVYGTPRQYQRSQAWLPPLWQPGPDDAALA